MDEWVTTEEAYKIKKVGLGQHRIADLARKGKIACDRVGDKKWMVKVRLNNGKYELVYLDSGKNEVVNETTELKTSESVGELKEQFVSPRKYSSEWAHSEIIVDAMLKMRDAPPEQTRKLLDGIERERIYLDDKELQEDLDRFVDAVEEDIKLGMSPGPEIRPTLNKIRMRMKKRYWRS
jgi:hypothetical protein